MTVVAGFEIEAGGRSEPGQSQAPAWLSGKAQKAAGPLAAAADSSSPNIAAAESFRSRWQSLVASLGSTAGGPGAGEAESGKINTRGQAAPEEGTGKSAGPTLPATAAPSQQSKPGATEASGSASGTIRQASAATQAGVPAMRATTALLRQAAADAPDQAGNSFRLTSASRADSSASARPTHSTNSFKREAASAEAAPGEVAVAAMNLPLAMPAPATVIPVPEMAGAKSQSSSEGSVTTPSGALAEELTAPSATLSNSAAVAPLRNRIPGTAATAGRSAPASRASLDGTGQSGPLQGEELEATDTFASGAAKAWSAGEEISSSGRMQNRVEEPLQTPYASRNGLQAPPSASQSGEVVAAPGSADRWDQGAGAVAAASDSSTAVLSSPEGFGLAAGRQAALQAAGRSSREAGKVEPISHDASLPAAGPAMEASTPAGVHGTMNANGGNLQSPSGGAAGSSPAETFAALDRDTGVGTPGWIHAGAQQAEAGFQDPALGWVGVRADMSAGGVHAALVPGSPEAAQALGGHMAGLNAYLAEQHTPVERLTLAAPEGRNADPGADQGASQSMHQGAGQNAGQGRSPESQPNTLVNAQPIPAQVSHQRAAQSGALDTTVQSARSVGTHISVMA
jgi:hypothetical protein